MNRNVRTIVAQIAITILAPSRCLRFAFGMSDGCDGGHVATRDVDVPTSTQQPLRRRTPGRTPIAEHQQHRADHHHGHRRAERPVLGDVELAVDHRPDHVARRAAQQRCGDEVTAHRDERQQHTGGDARAGQRHGHLQERSDAIGTEILAGFAHVMVDAIERHEQRQDHEAEVVVDDRDLHGRPGVEHVDRPAEDADVLQPLRELAVGRERDAPRQRADQEAGEAGHDDQRQHDPLPLLGDLEDQEVGHREAEDEAQRRGQDRDLQRRLEHLEERRVERVAVVLQRRVGHADRHARAGRRVLDAERVPHDQQDRQDEEEDVPDDRRNRESERRRPQSAPTRRIGRRRDDRNRWRHGDRRRHVTLSRCVGATGTHEPAAALTLLRMSTRRSSERVDLLGLHRLDLCVLEEDHVAVLRGRASARSATGSCSSCRSCSRGSRGP